FLVAYKLANVLRRLFAEGAFSASFLPVFSRVLVQEGKDKAQAFASQLLTVIVLVLSLFALLVIGQYRGVVRLLAPGFSPEGEIFSMTVSLGRICFPYLITTSVMALFCGILNTFDRFALPAATQILFNVFFIVTLIIGIIGGFPTSTVVYMLAVSTLIAGLVQVGLVWNAAERLKVAVRFVRPCFSPEVREVGRKMVPGILGAGVWQINLLIDTQACSFLHSGTVSYLYFADRINQLPLSVLGIALSTVLLPTLSKLIQGGRFHQAITEFNQGMSFASFLAIPATVFIITVPHFLVTMVYERGNFLPHQVAPVAAALRAFGCGLPAYIGAKIFAAAFFARGDTKTPVHVGVISVLANIAFILLLTPLLAHVGIALATALSSWINAGVLFWFLRRKSPLSITPKTCNCCLKQLLAAGIMGAGLILVRSLGEETFLMGSPGIRLSLLLLLVVGGFGLYGLLTYLFKAFPSTKMRS
ncbi:MAG: murein biosynthesis integral membrane protein MurJ, partial [Holosporales bacterium]|nr:murein biosynthesis integral membrane protein MurJ [Holosporales bacterium]